MKKQKVINLVEQPNKKDLKVVHELRQGLDQIDTFPVYTPDLQWFEQMVLVEKKNNKKKLFMDFSLFILVAVFVLSGILLSLSHMPVVFVFLQIITTVFIAAYTILRLKKKVNRV